METKGKTQDEVKQVDPEVINMSQDQFKTAMGIPAGAKIEAISNEEVKARLNRLITGKEPPPNKFVAYIVKKVQAGIEEFKTVQANMQELNTRLSQVQKRAIQIQGEQSSYFQDIMVWWNEEPYDLVDERSGDKPKEE